MIEIVDVLVLLSGGIDSAACAQFYKRQGYSVKTLFIDYGQQAALKEAEAALKISKHLALPLNKLSLKDANNKYIFTLKDKRYSQKKYQILINIGEFRVNFAGFSKIKHDAHLYPRSKFYYVNYLFRIYGWRYDMIPLGIRRSR